MSDDRDGSYGENTPPTDGTQAQPVTIRKSSVKKKKKDGTFVHLVIQFLCHKARCQDQSRAPWAFSTAAAAAGKTDGGGGAAAVPLKIEAVFRSS